MEPLRTDSERDRVPLLHRAADEDDALLLLTTPRRGLFGRLRRADVACLTVMGLVASFLMVWQPLERPIGSLTRSYRDHQHALQAEKDATFKYMTYDDIDADKRKRGYDVTYSPRGFTVDGRTTLLLGGSIHYSRSTPGMWEDLLRKAKNDGLNHIEMYIFWNLHEPTAESFHLHGRANITRFYDIAAEVGLFLNVRFGPYACAEWNNGGLPFWLDRIPGMNVRSSAEPWKREMSRFVKKMVEISRPYFATNGGPIIMAQIENEYDEEDDAYVAWCGDIVRELNTTIPWMMCNGKAANNTILTCNANDCIDFANTQVKDRPNEPLMWTEDEGWYQQWEHRPKPGLVPENTVKENWEDRDPEEISYVIARWFAVGAAHHNYYMYHGGNNYGRSPSAGVATKYADGVNLHSDGLSNEPKRTHLRKLHETLIECNEILLSNDRQIGHEHPLGTPSQIAYVYGSKDNNRVVFLQNDAESDATVQFEGTTYQMKRKSVIILKNDVILFDTSAVRQSYPHRQQRVYSELVSASSLDWQIWTESGDHRKAIVDKKPLEQLSVTQDETDYLLYKTRFTLTTEDAEAKKAVLNFTSTDANGFLVLIDGKFVGEGHRGWAGDERAQSYSFDLPTWLLDERERTKEHELSIVSVGLGLFTLGRMHIKGITGDVTINGHQSLIGSSEWKMFPGLIGEHLKIYDPKWNASVPWAPYSKTNTTKPTLSWYRTSFELQRPPKTQRAKPVEETSSILLDAVGLSRGHLYLNGHELGRHWLIKNSSGAYVQRYYHIPPDWLRSDPNALNELVIFDEMGGAVRDVRIVLSSMIEDFVDPEAEIRAKGPGHPRADVSRIVTA